jgi:hypothetical protein
MFDIEPWYGWLHLYDSEQDENSPFFGVEHNLFEYDRSIYDMPAHPLWEDFDSENLLMKILYADYNKGYCIIELIGEWNDLQFNDFRLMRDNCLQYLFDAGIDKFILLCENVFSAFLEMEDYYEAFTEELWPEGYIHLLKARAEVKEEFLRYGISAFVSWSESLDQLNWRKLHPDQILSLVEETNQKLLGKQLTGLEG